MAGMKFMMVYLMPVMMLLWFNSYSSGLTYYYFLANILTIGQTLVIRRMIDDEKIHAVMQANAAKTRTGRNPSSSCVTKSCCVSRRRRKGTLPDGNNRKVRRVP